MLVPTYLFLAPSLMTLLDVVAVRENYSVTEPGSPPKGVLFYVEIDDDVLVSCNPVRILYDWLI